jgi:preprotein translocase subunit SecB
VCLVECPRLLFPFARRIVADTTREGGYPPLLLDPIDFGRLLRAHRAPPGAAAPTPAAPPAGAKR